MNPFQQFSSKIKKLYTSGFLLSLIAMVVTLILIETHFKTSESGSFCNINDYWNCDRVNKSIFAEFLGIPVSIFGFLFYSFLSTTFFGLLKGWNFQRILKFIPLKWLPLLALIGTSIVSLWLLYYEVTILGNWWMMGVIKNLLYIGSAFWVYRFVQKNAHTTAYLLGFLTIMALFGVNFSLYLSNIELFVLEAICIFCFTQEIIIFIITLILILTLKQNQHDYISSASSQR